MPEALTTERCDQMTRWMVVISLCAILIITAISAPVASARGLTHFSNPGDPAYVQVELQGGGVNDSVFFSFPKWAEVGWASYFYAKGMPYGESYPSPVTIDVGGDGDAEWMWTRPEYGPMGHQTQFSDGNAEAIVEIGTPGGNSTTHFLLPYGAAVETVQLDIDGGVEGFTVLDNISNWEMKGGVVSYELYHHRRLL